MAAYFLPTELRTTTVSSQLNYHFSNVCVHACLGTQSCPTLCDPTDSSPPGSSVHGIFQARILEWVAMPSSRESSDPGIKPKLLASPALASKFFTSGATVGAGGPIPRLFSPASSNHETSHLVLREKCFQKFSCELKTNLH